MSFPGKTDTNPEDFFCHGHHLVLMPDGSIDEYDVIIGDYYVRVIMGNTDAECEDSNGSEAEYEVLPDGTLKVTYHIHDRLYDSGITWEEKTFVCCGQIVEHGSDLVFRVDDIRPLQRSG